MQIRRKTAYLAPLWACVVFGSACGGALDIDQQEQSLILQPIPAELLQAVPIFNGSEGFEHGFRGPGWTHSASGANRWSIVHDKALSGRSSARAGRGQHNSTSTLQTTIFVAEHGNVSFGLAVSSEQGYDHLIFEVDGIERGRWSGTQHTRVALPITVGFHSLRWRYVKDYSVSRGADTAWLDDIHFPPLWGETRSWWKDLQTVAASVTTEGILGTQPAAELAAHPACQGDIGNDWLLQRHGQAILDGVALVDADPVAAAQRFSDATRDLGRLAAHLQCTGDAAVLWDLAISKFWGRLRSGALNSATFCEGIQALWNPALLVVDERQHSGHSQVVAFVKSNATAIVSCLAAYPVDHYGAAFLATAEGRELTQVKGAAALQRLFGALADPKRLGLGLCPLVEHAQNSAGWAICLRGLNLPQACGGSSEQTLRDLGQVGVQYHHAAHASGGWRTQRVEQFPPQRFGDATTTLLQDLTKHAAACGRGGKGQGLSSAAAGLQRRIGGCMFSLVQRGWDGPGDRVVRCTQKHGFKPMPAITSTEFRLPASVCGTTNPASGKIDTKDELAAYSMGNVGRKLATENKIKGRKDRRKQPSQGPAKDNGHNAALNKSNNAQKVNSKSEWNKLVKAGKIKSNDHGFTEPPAKPSDPYRVYINPNDSARVQKSTEFHERLHVYFHQRGIRFDEAHYYKGVQVDSVHHALMKQKGWYRPTPWSAQGGCHETAAEQRARVLHECLFGESEVAGQGTLDPWINPTGAGSSLPDSCNSIDVRNMFKSNGDGATDPAPWDVPAAGPDYFAIQFNGDPGRIDPVRLDSSNLIVFPRVDAHGGCGGFGQPPCI